MTQASVPAAPRVSVALCTYNGGTYVREQLLSILHQSHRPDEVVVSDDGSRDDTVAIARATLATSDIASTILTDGHLGTTQNFARAISACSGDVVFLADQDDVWSPEKVRCMLDAFAADPRALLVFSNALLVDAQLRPLGRTQFDQVRLTPRLREELVGPNALRALARRNVVTGATVAFRRELMTSAAPLVDGWLHDEWLAIHAAARGGLRLVDDVLVQYRQHGRNQCGMAPESLPRQLASAATAAPVSAGMRRLQALRERLRVTSRRSAEVDSWLESALRFEAGRQRLPRQRLPRLPIICVQLLAGRYHRFADGVRSAAKDLLAQAGKSR